MDGGRASDPPANVVITEPEQVSGRMEDQRISARLNYDQVDQVESAKTSDAVVAKETKASRSSENFTSVEDESQKYLTSFQIWCNPGHPMIANDLQTMSRENRELVWSDLSGNRRDSMYYQELAESIRETPTNVERAMQELEVEISRLPTFTLLRKVQLQHPEYVNNVSFRLKFLRCERFNAKEAMKRMMRYFEEKNLLWGEECLGREISMLDLDEEDVAYLRSGAHSITPNVDSGGRRIYLTNRGAMKCSNPTSIIRANWYMIMKTLEDDENVQTMGVIRLGYLLNYKPSPGSGDLLDPGIFRKLSQFSNILPIRFSAVYIVSEPRLFDSAINVFLALLSSAVRVRTRLLSGSYQECRYQLACLGIVDFPIGEDGTMDMTEHLAWVESCCEAEGRSRKRQRREDARMEISSA